MRATLDTPPADRVGFVGRFHAGSPLRALKEAVLSGRHLLLAGPSGAGKELSAGAVARLAAGEGPLLKVAAHNAARFASEEEAAATLFGVAPDLMARLRRVRVPSLGERVADIPTLFRHLMERALQRDGLDEETVLPLFKGAHYESSELLISGKRRNR